MGQAVIAGESDMMKAERLRTETYRWPANRVGFPIDGLSVVFARR
jgi:hypothetical protein